MHKTIEKYVLYEEIGAGQSGKVHRAVHRKTKQNYAIKIIPISKFTQCPKLEEFTSNEVQILGRLKHPNVIGFHEMLKTANNIYLVYDFCGEGTLEELITQRGKLSEAEALRIFQQLLGAFSALYKENILHRDLKPTNILFQKDVVKVADFGFCKRMQSQSTLTLTMVGSPMYMAPEILKGFPYNTKSDIWSLGVVLYEMLFGVCPYEDDTLAGLVKKIERNKLIIPKEKNAISSNTETLLTRLLTIDPGERIDWQSLLSFDLQVPSEDALQIVESNEQKPSSKIQRSSPARKKNNNKENNDKDDAPEKDQSIGSPVKSIDSPGKSTGTNATLSENSKLLNSSPDSGQTLKSQSSLKVLDNIDLKELQHLKESPSTAPVISDRDKEQNLDYSEIVTAVLLERNKGIFLIHVLTSVLNKNIPRKEPCAFLIAKRAYSVWRGLLNELSEENTDSKYQGYKDWESFKASDEYQRLCNFLKDEMEETTTLYEDMRTTVGEAIENYEDFDAAAKKAIIEEAETEKVNLMLYCRLLTEYIEEFKNNAKESLAKGESDAEAFELLIHANEVADAAGLDGFTLKNLSQKVNWRENEYFKNIRKYSKERLLDLVTVKISSLKAKLFLSPT